MTDDARSFWAWVVLTTGGLIILLCGPCTLFFASGALVGLAKGEDAGLAGFILVVSLIIGGLPTAGGIVLALNGFESLRKLRSQPPAGPPS